HDDDGDRDRPLVVRCIVSAAGRVAHDGEDCEADDDHDRPDHLTPADVLGGYEVAEGQREDDRRHEQRLDHREPSVVERNRLEGVADEKHGRAGEPPVLPKEPEERRGVREGDPAQTGGALRLQRRRQREARRSHQRERRRHSAGIRRRGGRSCSPAACCYEIEQLVSCDAVDCAAVWSPWAAPVTSFSASCTDASLGTSLTADEKLSHALSSCPVSAFCTSCASLLTWSQSSWTAVTSS